MLIGLPDVQTQYLAYLLFTRNLDNMMTEYGISVDHPVMNRALVKYSPQLEAECHGCKHPVSLRQC
jgi:transposase-like protein